MIIQCAFPQIVYVYMFKEFLNKYFSIEDRAQKQESQF